MDGNETRKLGRRALLTAGAAGVAAAAAQAVAPAGMRAGRTDGEPVQLGYLNEADHTTEVRCLGASVGDTFAAVSRDGNGLRGVSQHANNSGVFGYCEHADGYGVLGQNVASRAFGILGSKDHGVYGYSEHTDGYGVLGQNVPSGAVGILGSKDHGVYGHAKDTEGVHGESDNNHGVVATSGGQGKAGALGTTSAADGYGVQGRNTVSHTHGYLGGQDSGVYGSAREPSGSIPWPTGGALGSGSIGVRAFAPVDSHHYGLSTTGRVHFSGRAGVLTIPQGKSSVGTAVSALTATSMVLATLQTNRAGIYVQAAVASLPGKIAIYLNQAVPKATKVAYFVLD